MYSMFCFVPTQNRRFHLLRNNFSRLGQLATEPQHNACSVNFFILFTRCRNYRTSEKPRKTFRYYIISTLGSLLRICVLPYVPRQWRLFLVSCPVRLFVAEACEVTSCQNRKWSHLLASGRPHQWHAFFRVAPHQRHAFFRVHVVIIVLTSLVLCNRAVGSTEKPIELYHIIERFCLGRRRLELFGGVRSCDCDVATWGIFLCLPFRRKLTDNDDHRPTSRSSRCPCFVVDAPTRAAAAVCSCRATICVRAGLPLATTSTAVSSTTRSSTSRTSRQRQEH